MKNENTTNAAAVLNVLNVPSLDSMPEVVKTAAAAEKQAAELVKQAAAAAEQAQKDIAAAIAAGDIDAAQKALKAQGKAAAVLEKAKAAHKTAAAELEKAKTAHKTATAELEQAKTQNPYKQPSAADYCIVAAAELVKAGETLTAKAVATAAIALMPEDSRPSTPNGTEMTARGVNAVLNCIKVENK